MVAAPAMPELGSAAETTKLGLKSESTPISVETESATAPDMFELLESMKSITAPVSVELETAEAPAAVELKVEAMPSALDLDAGVMRALVEPEAAAEAAGAFESEAAPFDGTGPATLNLDASPSESNARDEAPVFTLGAKGLQGNFLLGTTTLVLSLAISHWKSW